SYVDCSNSRRVRRHGGRPSQRSTYPTLVTPLLPTRPTATSAAHMLDKTVIAPQGCERHHSPPHGRGGECSLPCKGALRPEALLPPASDAAVGSLGRAYVTDVVILAAHPRVPLRAGGCAVTLQPAAQPDLVRRVYPKVSCQVGLTAFAVPARCFVTRQEPSAHASGGTSARAPHLRGSGRSCAVAGNFPVR